MCVSFSLRQIVAMGVVLLFSANAQAAVNLSGGHDDAASIGEPGKASEATRIIEIEMTDNRFALEQISVESGQTIRFVLKNTGEFVHEFNIGTAAMHAEHQTEMAMMFDTGVLEVDKIRYDKMDMGGGRTMDHGDPNSVLLEPEKSAQIVWKFNSDARLEFACNIPGHYDAGMMGDIVIR